METVDAVIVGAGPAGLSAALILGRCRRRVVVCDTGRPRNASSHALHGFRSSGCHGIGLREEPIARLEGRDGILERIVFTTGDVLERRAMFFSTPEEQRSDLAARLGCVFTEKGTVKTGEYETTNVPGLYVAGDASRLVQLAIVAASEGAEAAFAMNTAMLKEDLAARERAERNRGGPAARRTR